MILIISKKKGVNMKQTAIMSYWLSSTTKCTSMGLGNQKGWFSNLNNAPNNN
jgi:hypothetical protein